MASKVPCASEAASEEAGPRMTPFHGGFGQLNYQELSHSDPEAYVCRGDDGSVQALFWDFTITHPGESTINQVFYLADQPAKPKEPVELNLTRLAEGSYRLVATKVGYRANDVQSAWRELGSPNQLTRSQVATLRKASAGQPVVDETIRVTADGKFSRQFEMRESDVWLVELCGR